ncbi:hypothetical protein [Paenibacillus naphthalenovorans]|uniref:hypothetical protein n=1 Tax=Paenibacillus naphthalenovorans TaxID=162209 RepID=UPI003D2BC893
MITQKGLERLAKALDQILVSGTYTVDGVKKPIGLRRSIVQGNTVKKHLYLSDLEGNGRLTKFELIDDEGNVFAFKNDDKQKTSRKGLLISFEFTIQEVSN